MAAKRPSLPDEVKRFIINALAAFDTPSQVSAAVRDEFGLEVARQVVEAHDPTKFAGRNLAPKWREMFEAARKAFIEDATLVPIAHRGVRLRALQRMAQKAESKGNMAMATKIIEQAAKEVGNAFTNKVDLQSSDGSMSPPSLADFYGAMRKPE